GGGRGGGDAGPYPTLGGMHPEFAEASLRLRGVDRMSVMFRRVAALAALFLIGGVDAGWAQDKVSILLDYPQPEGIHAGIELPLKNGGFRDAGLEAEARDGKGSNLTTQQVAAGQADIGLAQLSAMAVAASNGVPVIAVMGIAQRGDLSLSVAEDTGVKTLKD